MLHDHAAFAGNGPPAHVSFRPEDAPSASEAGCPVERLGRELRVLYEVLGDCHAIGLDGVRQEVMDRMSVLGEQASYLQATSLYGALFQVAVANGQLDDMADAGVRLAEDKSPSEGKRHCTKREIEKAARAAHRSLWSAAVLLLSHCGKDEVDAASFFLGGLTDFQEIVAERLAGRSSATFRELHAQRMDLETAEQFQMEADALAARRHAQAVPDAKSSIVLAMPTLSRRSHIQRLIEVEDAAQDLLDRTSVAADSVALGREPTDAEEQACSEASEAQRAAMLAVMAAPVTTDAELLAKIEHFEARERCNIPEPALLWALLGSVKDYVAGGVHQPLLQAAE